MNDRITLGAAVLVAGVLAVRWAFSPVREADPYDGDITVETSLDDLLGEWEPVYGTALEQARGGRS